MPRGNDASDNESHYPSADYPPSPAQPPIPLPDVPLLKTEPPDFLTPLIAFDTSTPSQPLISLPADPGSIFENDLDNDIITGRSPPFREAPLPQDSPPPLPIRARTLDPEYQRIVESTIMADSRSYAGHSRTPNFSCLGTRTSSTPILATASTLENLSRTIRGYVPSPIAIATTQSPSSDSRGADIILPSTSSSPPSRQGCLRAGLELRQEYHNSSNSRLPHPIRDQSSHSEGVGASSPGRQSSVTMGGSGLAQAMQRNRGTHAMQPSDQAENITWARWDVLNERRLLIVGYVCGLQVWDCTNLSLVDEVLNLNFVSVEWRTLLETRGSATTVRVVHAAVLPSSGNQFVHHEDADPFLAQRPLLGILLQSATEGMPEKTLFLLYSIQYKHQVAKKLSFLGAPSTFVFNEEFTVISARNPTILHILSSTTFQTLHQISFASLELFSPQFSFISHAIPDPSTPLIPTHSTDPQDQNMPGSPKSPISVPVFALSHRLLAYVSPSSSIMSPPQEPLDVNETRRFSPSSNASPASGPESSSSPFGFGPTSLGQISTIIRADVGHAALKVGETVFSGVKHLGGMALEAAKNHVVSGQTFGMGIGNRRPGGGGGGGGRFVSRSAPDHLSVHDETEQKPRPSSSTSIDDLHSHPTKVAPSTNSSRERGHRVTIVDLAPLRNRRKVSKVDEILVSTSQPVTKLEFSADGTSIGVALRDGHSVKVFKLKPSPYIATSSYKEKADEEGEPEHYRGSATQVYDLHRGRTSAIIESIAWATDGRYIGIGTMNRTVHIYAANPYGGKPDLRNHLEGRIRNIEAIDRWLTPLTPIARLRGSKPSHTESQAALALTFISDSELLVTPQLLPASPPNRRTYSPPPLSPPRRKLGTNYQHLLLFDPEEGVLSLHRLTLEKIPSRDPIIGGVAASIQALGVTSMSFPDTSNLGRLSTSPSAKPVATAKTPEPSMELAAKVSQVATYNLKRGKDWDEVTKTLDPAGGGKPGSSGGDWLAEAELSTCSGSQQVLRRSIYLSHQFSFRTLGEDYHALIRSYQLHVSGNKVDVRREVEVRTSVWNIAAFAEGFPSALDAQRDPSSFDEPISSAISGSFDNSNIPHILPMYPNGVPGANPKSLRNSIPIRAISGLGDGVSESFGRIRNRVRSPRGAARSHVSNYPSVPLEFDEDEEFLDQHGEPLQHGIKSTSSHILSSTQKLLDADVVGTVDEELFDGWDVEDKQAIDEEEQFQDIAPASYLVEEEHQQQDSRKVHSKR